MPAVELYLFPQLGASKSAIRHHDYPNVFGNGDRQQIERLACRVYPLARFVGGHGDPRHRGGASPIDHAHDDDAESVGEHSRVYGEREVAGRPQRQDPPHQRGEAGADVYLVGRGRGAVGAVVEPLAESLADGGKSAREGQGGDDGVLASALGDYCSERPSLGLRLCKMGNGLSLGPVNLATFGWEARGEPPAALRFAAHKDAGKPRAFQVRKPVSGQTYPCKPVKGEGVRRLRAGAAPRASGRARRACR